MQLQLDYKAACEARDAGIQVATDHANAVNLNWSDKAYEKLKEFLNTWVGEFQGEDVRSYAAIDDDFPLPPSERAWGGTLRKAAFAGLIKKVGIKSTRNPKAHCANSAVWIKV